MTDVMEASFQYAQKHKICSLLNQEHEYANTRLCAEKQEEALIVLLDQTAQKHYDTLRDEKNLLSTFYERALFRAGSRLAMELSR